MPSRPITLITGATGGIGSALVKQLASTHDLILSARASQHLDQLCQEYSAQALPLDLGQPETFVEALNAVPKVTNVIHNAAMVELGSIAEQSYQTWQKTLTINTIAPAELTRLLLPKLRTAQGMVVFINSTAALHSGPTWGSYAASKTALRVLADVLREEEAQYGVRVASVFPGRTATAMQEKVRQQEGAEYHQQHYLNPDQIALLTAQALQSDAQTLISEIVVRPVSQQVR